MRLKHLYRFLASTLILVLSFSLFSKSVFKVEEVIILEEQDYETPNSEQDGTTEIVQQIEATVPAIYFKIEATLIFIFELTGIIENATPNHFGEIVTFLSSYRQNLFCSVIQVNAP